MIRTTILPLSLTIALADAAAAQDIFTKGVQISDTSATDADLYVEDKTVLDANLCVGSGCSLAEGYTDELVRLKQANANILFEDTSPPSGSFPSNDWRIKINENTQNGRDLFGIEDVTGGTLPFAIEAGAPSNALHVDDGGKIGLGTMFPQKELHIAAQYNPTIRFEHLGNPAPGIWDLRADDSGFYFEDRTNFRVPFSISGETSSGLRIYGNAVGVGMLYPQAKLHVNLTDAYSLADPDYALFIGDAYQGQPQAVTPAAMAHIASGVGNAQLRIEELSATTSPRTLLNLQNNGRPEIVMGNSATGGEWSFGAGTNFVLKVGALGSLSSAKAKVFTVRNDGDAILTGSLTTGGTTCGTGCDRVFDADYDLPSIAEHAAAMRVLGHLPNVGPTIEGAPINVSDKLGRMLNELEHAHLYIAALDDENRALRAELAEMRAEMAGRLARLEAAASTE